MNDPEKLVQRHVEAYNRRDLEAFLVCYADDAKLWRPLERLIESGHEALQRRYRKRVDEAPNLHATLVRRLVLDRFVVDHEHVTGTAEGSFDAIATYEVVDGRIRNVWFCVP